MRAEATAAAPKTLVQGRNVEVTPAIKSYVEEKCSKAVAHYSEGIKEASRTRGAVGPQNKPPVHRVACVHCFPSRG